MNSMSFKVTNFILRESFVLLFYNGIKNVDLSSSEQNEDSNSIGDIETNSEVELSHKFGKWSSGMYGILKLLPSTGETVKKVEFY